MRIFNDDIAISTLTASRMVSTDANKKLQTLDAAGSRALIKAASEALHSSETRTDYVGYVGAGYTLVHGAQSAIPANTLGDGSVVKMSAIFYINNANNLSDLVCALSDSSSSNYPSTSYVFRRLGPGGTPDWFPTITEGTLKIDFEAHIGEVISGTTRRLHMYASGTWLETQDTSHYVYLDTSINVGIDLYPHIAVDFSSGSMSLGRKTFTAQFSRQ